MSKLTDYGENQFADWVRGESIAIPGTWYIAPLSAASDSAYTEVVGDGIVRFPVGLSLANWAGTQAPASTLASTGTSHETSNNAAIDMGIAEGAVGTVTHVGFFDAEIGGNCWMYAELLVPIVTNIGVAVSIANGELVFTLGLGGGMTDYLANKVIDKLFRGQTYDWPASTWLRAYTAAPTNAGGGTEVGGAVGYLRVEIESTQLQWSGTQGPGSTDPSNGTGGRISNNVEKAFPDPTGPQGNVGWLGLGDASSAGNLLFWGAMPLVKTIGVDRPLICEADSIGITWA